MPQHGIFAAMDAATSAMGAERLRMTVASENLAHANSTRPGADGLPYRRQLVRFETVLDRAGRPDGRVAAEIVPDQQHPYISRYDPSHPDANEDGYVVMPDINPVLELTDMMLAGKAYEANANAVSGFMRMHEQALRIGEG